MPRFHAAFMLYAALAYGQSYSSHRGWNLSATLESDAAAVVADMLRSMGGGMIRMAAPQR